MRQVIFIFCLLLTFNTAYAEEETEQAEAPEVIYLGLQPQFTVNLLGNKHYLRTTIQLQLNSEETEDVIKENDPAIRHALIVLLSNNKVDAISTLAGKEKLRKDAVIKLNETLKIYTNKEGVIDVFFTEFVSQ
ncbi:MAG: flagellar biosynthesis protein FliL [Piscirickettsiaceae bacterium]|nr:MAG: flagellar biosynthesis protein FliL [Piscirickettsiaceae bacterium]